MNLVFITEEQFDSLNEKLQKLNKRLDDLIPPEDRVLDNRAFLKLMKISASTAQIWRHEGLIAFTKKGKKIYYQMADIDQFLNNNRKGPSAYKV